jgi:hypothetical protein
MEWHSRGVASPQLRLRMEIHIFQSVKIFFLILMESPLFDISDDLRLCEFHFTSSDSAAGLSLSVITFPD